jgi:spore germination cell wall hydrolase CwlJ-like protein
MTAGKALEHPIRWWRALVALALLSLAGPALADTGLSPVPAEDDRVLADAADHGLSASSPAGALADVVRMASVAHPVAAPAADVDCLATAVWFESRGEALEGQLAVAQAVVNRARSGRWGDGVCGVIRAPRQFNFPAARVRRDTETFATALAVARVALGGLWHDIAQGAHSFHAARLNPRWRLTRVARVGNHVFYR